MPWCGYWICGLYSNGMVVGRINKTSEGKAFLTTDKLQASEGLEVRITSKLDLIDGDYGLAVVSCANTVVNGSYSNNSVAPSSLSETDIDLSKLEVIAFFSYMDEKGNRRSSETATEYFNGLFETFVKKDSDGKSRELLHTYGKQPSSPSYAKA